MPSCTSPLMRASTRRAQSSSSMEAPPHEIHPRPHGGPPMSPTNHQVRLAARPSGLPEASDWSFTEERVPTPGAGEFVVSISHLSLDPAMRGWMNAGTSYIDPVEVGDVMRAGAVGEVDRKSTRLNSSH